MLSVELFLLEEAIVMVDVAVFYHLCRIAPDNRVIGNISDDNGSHGDDGSISDADIAADGDIGSEPDEIADLDMFRYICTTVRDGIAAVVIVRTEHDLAILS